MSVENNTGVVTFSVDFASPSSSDAVRARIRELEKENAYIRERIAKAAKIRAERLIHGLINRGSYD
jgi:Arc/MetJ-type ribon-helix-helix transcriptional regulator